jgi:glycosyltransferase involved in cell wall biosynthesis
MKILIADFDLFLKIGGGQTFYKQVIEKNPQLEFYYLLKQETPDNPRPKNAQGIIYKPKYSIEDFNNYFNVTPPRWSYRSFVIASNIAYSVSGYNFEVVDVPDYEQYTSFLRPALEYHQVKCNKIALSMHGKISTTIRMDWFGKDELNIPLDMEEKMQFKTADLRYGISKTYLQEWENLVNLKSHYFNPLHFIDLPKLLPLNHTENKPSLHFIGRTEKRKGPDIFVDLVWWLNSDSYSDANIIGPHSYDDCGNSSQSLLQRMIDKRLVNISILPPKTRQELDQIFASKSMVFLPSRYDTLNLLALESLFSGCPTVIGNGAGVCQFLRDNFPQLTWVELDTNNMYNSLPQIQSLLDNYDDYRQNLQQTLLSIDTQTNDPNLADIYNSESQPDLTTKLELNQWYSQLISFWESGTKQQNLASKVTKKLINDVAKPSYGILKGKLTKLVEDTRTSQLVKSPFLLKQYRQVFKLGEYTELELENKLLQIWNLAETQEPESKGIKGKIQSGYRVDRVRIWREIARLERMRGNDLISTTYQIRSMRALGWDRFNELSFVTQTLQEKGFTHEAKVIQAMYGDLSQQEQNCTNLLKEAYQNNLNYNEQDYEFIEDHRGESNYKVSVIVSLYNAAGKLARFLEILTQQTLFQQNQVEIILIDSGSPDVEYKVFQELLPKLTSNTDKLPVIYARSKNRETIQNAWNRGILLSRAPYITFLGVDETIVPECLEILAQELEQNPDIDWVVGHSLVTNVDMQGNRVNDIMLYDRRDYDQNLVYLDTCYLTYVGGLYRRRVHEQSGYYDMTFRGAGDTEFKNRILPYINTKMVDRVLGLFLNYPDERTTQSPLAEIEDIRAWYLHRTVGGVKYAFSGKAPAKLEQFLLKTLSYRKSYCEHFSSDVEYAANLAQFLPQINPNSKILELKPTIEQLLTLYRNLDWIEELSTFKPLQTISDTTKKAKQIESEHRKIVYNIGKVGFNPNYDIFHDNRHEQHANLWKTQLNKL